MCLGKELSKRQKGEIIATKKLGIRIVRFPQLLVALVLPYYVYGNPPKLEQWVKEEWDAVPINYYRNLIKSMPRRVQAGLAANGGQTKY
ncbi:6644_t:CDS:2 [Ambispora gerdemannii]|uniref:6644_t:CDS:1 n=1 Tax=Ambispora gerdemannii TaxID=144530 RepID=A0A9N8ZVI2_9GLOM|nr:6644_t:CDS:2 [Ambispora gerdemannii]